MYYKVRSSEGRVVTRCVYNVLGINCEGRKELLGMYLSESEGANFWLQVLNDLQARGVDDILIACIDNLKGFAEAIESIFPATEVQLCVVHQVRNSLRYVASKDQKEFMRDLKKVYRAPNKQAAESHLEQLSEKWDERYPVVIKSWKTNWERLTAYFAYSPAIRKLIYTTNAVEGFHRQVRKVTKNKGAFVNDKALEKLIYLAVRNIQKKWTQPLQNWSLTIQQLAIRFEGRVNLGLL
jgi:transposase-like protein